MEPACAITSRIVAKASKTVLPAILQCWFFDTRSDIQGLSLFTIIRVRILMSVFSIVNGRKSFNLIACLCLGKLTITRFLLELHFVLCVHFLHYVCHLCLDVFAEGEEEFMAYSVWSRGLFFCRCVIEYCISLMVMRDSKASFAASDNLAFECAKSRLRQSCFTGIVAHFSVKCLWKAQRISLVVESIMVSVICICWLLRCVCLFFGT